MAHHNARLTPFAWQPLISRVQAEGWPVAEAARALGVSRATAQK